MSFLKNLKSPAALKDNKGFTLVELLISLMILSLIMSGIYTFLTSSNNISLHLHDNSNRQAAVDNTIQSIRAHLANAKEMEIIGLDGVNTSDNDYYYIYSDPKGDIMLHSPGALGEVTLTSKTLPRKDRMIAVFTGRDMDTDNRYSRIEVDLGVFTKKKVDTYFASVDAKGITATQWANVWNPNGGYITNYYTTITMTPHNTHNIKFDAVEPGFMGAAVKYKMPEETVVDYTPGGGGGAGGGGGGGAGGGGGGEGEDEGTEPSPVFKWGRTNTSSVPTPQEQPDGSYLISDTITLTNAGTKPLGSVVQEFSFVFGEETYSVVSVSGGGGGISARKGTSGSSVMLLGSSDITSESDPVEIPITIKLTKAAYNDDVVFEPSAITYNVVNGNPCASLSITMKPTASTTVTVTTPKESNEIWVTDATEILPAASQASCAMDGSGTATIVPSSDGHRFKLQVSGETLPKDGSFTYLVQLTMAKDEDNPPMSVNIHYDTINKDSNVQWCWKVPYEYSTANSISGDTAATVNKGESLYIRKTVSWSESTAYSKDYNSIKNTPITDIWIQGGTVYESKPANWMTHDPITQDLTMKFTETGRTDNGDGTTTVTGNIIGSTSAALVTGDHWTGTLTLPQEPKSVSEGTLSGKNVSFAGDVSGTFNAGDNVAAISGFYYVVEGEVVSALSAGFIEVNKWNDNSGELKLVITNNGSSTVNGWTGTITFDGKHKVNYWQFSGDSKHASSFNISSDDTIAAGESKEYTFQIENGGYSIPDVSVSPK